MSRRIVIDIDNKELLELLARLEHEQWSHWIKHQHELRKYSLNYVYAQKWKEWLKQADIPYDELSEKEKESDKEWAQKVLEAINAWWWKQP